MEVSKKKGVIKIDSFNRSAYIGIGKEKEKEREEEREQEKGILPQGYNTDQEFRLLVIGPSASGKSTLVKRILHENLRGKFNEIFIMAPTIMQPLWKSVHIKNSKENKTDECTDEKFLEFIERIKENGKNDRRSLLILDDIINTDLTKIHSALCTEVLRLRHYKCSIIICSQNYKGVPPFIRTNVSNLIMFINPNKSELQKAQEELGDRFMEKYTEIVKERYQYIHANLKEHELDDKRYTDKIIL